MATTNPPPPVPQKKHGCFFYGCIISLVLFVLFVAAILFATWYGLRTLRTMAANYTDTSPMVMKKVELPADQMKDLTNRIAVFSSAMNAHSNTPPLVLTGPELEAWLASSPGVTNNGLNFFVTLDGDQIKGEISLPLDGLTNSAWSKMVDVKGRYLNGGGTFKAGITNGQLSVYVESLEVKGMSLPDSLLVGFRQQNLADGFNKNAKPNPFERFQSIEVKDGKLIVTPKGN